MAYIWKDANELWFDKFKKREPLGIAVSRGSFLSFNAKNIITKKLSQYSKKNNFCSNLIGIILLWTYRFGENTEIENGKEWIRNLFLFKRSYRF